MTEQGNFVPDEALINEALAEHAVIEREKRFNRSEEARRKQNTAFADERVEEEAGGVGAPTSGELTIELDGTNGSKPNELRHEQSDGPALGTRYSSDGQTAPYEPDSDNSGD